MKDEASCGFSKEYRQDVPYIKFVPVLLYSLDFHT